MCNQLSQCIYSPHIHICILAYKYFTNVINISLECVNNVKKLYSYACISYAFTYIYMSFFLHTHICPLIFAQINSNKANKNCN